MSVSKVEQQPLGPPDFGKIMRKAFTGGIAGAGAMVVQVTTLMWMRTIMNYQYRYGGTMIQAMKLLYNDGGGGIKGVLRFYRGYLPALLQGPLSRFGDTASNAGTLALLDSYEMTRNLPVAAKTATASTAAGLFRILLMPIDCFKTTLQVEGKDALKMLRVKMATNGPQVLWAGSLASAGATMVGHFPWFYTYNTLDAYLSPPQEFCTFVGRRHSFVCDAPTRLLANAIATWILTRARGVHPPSCSPFTQKLMRNALMGFCSSVVSDTASNSIRVIKTTKQTHKTAITYIGATKEVLAKDGIVGLFGRGLGTRYLTNGIQGLLFSVMWRLIQDQMNKK